jgi:hypothetical protein
MEVKRHLEGGAAAFLSAYTYSTAKTDLGGWYDGNGRMLNDCHKARLLRWP